MSQESGVHLRFAIFYLFNKRKDPRGYCVLEASVVVSVDETNKNSEIVPVCRLHRYQCNACSKRSGSA